MESSDTALHDRKDSTLSLVQGVRINQRQTDQGWLTTDKLICSACGQRYRSPRLLPCLHTFCAVCISGFQTYPATEEKTTSTDAEFKVDTLASDETESSSENLLNDLAPSTFSESSDYDCVADTFLPRGRSNHAKLIEKRIHRSRSCNVNGFELSFDKREFYSSNPMSLHIQSLKRSNRPISVGSRAAFDGFGLPSTQSIDSMVRPPGAGGHEVKKTKKKKKKTTRVILCPGCLEEVRVSVTLDELPRNYMIERLLVQDSATPVVSSVALVRLACDVCGYSNSYDGDDNEKEVEDVARCDPTDSERGAVTPSGGVVARCVECEENLCSPCEAAHKRQKKTRHHQILAVGPYRRENRLIDGNSCSEDHLNQDSKSCDLMNSIQNKKDSNKSNGNIISNSSNSIKNNNKFNNSWSDVKHNHVHNSTNGYDDINGNNNNNNNNNNNDTDSLSGSMSTIAESVSDEPVSKPYTKDKQSHALKRISKLKLPNLQQFGRLWTHDIRKISTIASKPEVERMEIEKPSSSSEMLSSRAPLSTDSGGLSPSLSADSMGEPSVGRNRRDDLVGTQSEMRNESVGVQRRGYAHKVHAVPHRPILCPKHPSAELRLFCITCEESVCDECARELHSGHKCQAFSKELFQTQMEDVELFIQMSIPRMEVMDSHLETFSRIKIKVVERSQKVKDEINAFMDQYVDALEKHRQNLLSQVTSLAEVKERALSVSQFHIQRMRSEVEHTCGFVSDLLAGASDQEILSVKRLIRARLESLLQARPEPELRLNDFLRFCRKEKGEVINNFQMYGKVVDGQPCATMSFIGVESLKTAQVSQRCNTVLTVCDTLGEPYSGNDVTIKVWVIMQEQRIKSLPVTLTSLHRGTHQIEFVPVHRGSHLLHVAVNGHPVQNSPWRFSVRPRAWLSQDGAWPSRTSSELEDDGHGRSSNQERRRWSYYSLRESECFPLPGNRPRSSIYREVTL